MNKKTAGRISAMAMASMMMMSVCVVNASAEENEPITQLNLKKTVTTDGNTYQPNTSFSFHVENGEAAENWRDNVVYAGVTGGITGLSDNRIPAIRRRYTGSSLQQECNIGN